MPRQREEDEARIRQQFAKFVAGIQAKDLEGLRRLYATDVVSFDVEPRANAARIERTALSHAVTGSSPTASLCRYSISLRPATGTPSRKPRYTCLPVIR
jgi:hypothetical protein